MAFGQVGGMSFTSPEWLSGFTERNWALRDREDAQNFSAQSAQAQMQFQADMSNSAYQRAVNDMRAAGLNPMLAYQQGGASSPQGAAFPGVLPHRTGFGSAGGGVSGQTAAQVGLTEAEEEFTRGKSMLQEQEFKVLFHTAEKLLQEGLNLKTANEKMLQEIGIKKYTMIREKYEALLAMQDFESFKPEELAALKATAELLRLEIPKALNEATAEGSAWKREVAPYLRDLGTISHSARDVAAGAAAASFATGRSRLLRMLRRGR